MFRLLSIFVLAHIATSDLVFSPQDGTVEIDKEISFTASLSDDITLPIPLMFYYQQDDIASVTNKSVKISKNEKQLIFIKGEKPGHVIITGNVSNPSVNADEAFIRVTVGKSTSWMVFSDIVGWIYFAAWSISFYPQMYENWKRKRYKTPVADLYNFILNFLTISDNVSVVGLNFDFLALNFVGFFLYSLFNIGLYAFEPIKKIYHKRYPHSVNPVQINDIVFSVHAFAAVAATFVQCYIYEKENQKVSKFARGLIAFYGGFLGIVLILSFTGVMELLDFLYYCSYVKLSITLIKYIPQAYMNYKRKSTVGWSIGNIFLDFTGGMLSMLQMIINSYNYDDWESIFGDPTKFGLGLFSVLFDIFFILQHYVFYRHSGEAI